MDYYHIRVDYLDRELNANQTRFEYDFTDSEVVKSKFVIPFLNETSMLVGGTKIGKGSVRQIQVYKTQLPIDRLTDVANSHVSRNVIFVYHRDDVLNDKEYATEVTRQFLDECHQYLAVQPVVDDPVGKQPKVFISHSSQDKDFVNALVSLLEFLGLDEKTLFCSSADGLGIPVGEDIFEYLKKQYHEHDLFVIFIHSENYYRSAVSLNEMGAAWVLKCGHCSLLVKDFPIGAMAGVVNGKEIAIKVDAGDATARLNELRDQLTAMFKLPVRTQNSWERHRNSFLAEVNR